MTYQIFTLPPQQPLTAAGRILPGAKASFFLTTTDTPTPVYTTSELNVAHTQPVEADGGGRFPTIYLDPSITYKVTITDANDVLLYTIDPVNDDVLDPDEIAGLLTQEGVGAALYPETAAESAASIPPTLFYIPSNDALGEFNAKRFNFKTSNSGTQNVTALNNAIEASFYGGGTPSGTVLMPEGAYNMDGEVIWLSGVSLRGMGPKHTRLLDVTSQGTAVDGALLKADTTLYNQRAIGFSIDGTSATGDRRALYIKAGNRTLFSQVNFGNYSAVTDGYEAMLFEGAGYGLKWDHCNWTANKRHWKIQRVVGTALFPTQMMFDTNIFEEATEAGGTAMHVLNGSSIKLRDCTVQNNDCLYTLALQTTAAGETSDDHEVCGGWWEENGNGQTGSIGIYVFGAAGRRSTGCRIHGVNFHQPTIKNPDYQIFYEWTDQFAAFNNREYFGAGTKFVHNGGNNIREYVDWRGTTSTCDSKTPIIWATTNFNGKGGISVNSSYNVTPTRDNTGEYTLTFQSGPPAAGYIINANSEDGSGDLYQLASPGPASSTTSFKLFVCNAAGVAVDGRTIQVTVWAIPA